MDFKGMAVSVPVEVIVDQMMSENPKCAMLIFINDKDQIRMLHSTMEFHVRAYLLKVADTICTQQIFTTRVKSDDQNAH